MISEKIKNRFDAWWDCRRVERPMIRLITRRQNPLRDYAQTDLSCYTSFEDMHTNPNYRVGLEKNLFLTHEYCYEAMHYIDLNYGPGSMAAYLGLKPNFMEDTVWYEHLSANSLSDIPLPVFNPYTKYFLKHIEQIKKAVELSNNEFPVCIPDILENIDVLALLRGNEQLCYDIMDEPEKVKKYLDCVADIYMSYYDSFYQAVKDGKENKECMYTAFSIWGREKTAKLQCDFACLLSVSQFQEFIFEYIERQTKEIKYTMYHLDGKDAVRHLPCIMKLDNLNALQWTPGAGQPDGGHESWYGIYDTAMNNGKALWISFCDGSIADMIEKAKKIARRYDNKGLYFHFPVIEEKDKILFLRAFGE